MTTTTTETLPADHRNVVCQIAPAKGGFYWVKLVRDAGAYVHANRQAEVAGIQFARQIYGGKWVLVSAKFLAGLRKL